MRRYLALALVLLWSSAAGAAEQHITANNVITTLDCTALGEPWGGCTGLDTGWPELDGYDGADIAYAIGQCTGSLKCVVDLVPAAVYENVAIDIQQQARVNLKPGRDRGRNSGLTMYTSAQFANGLVIDGHGAILRSRVPTSAYPNAYVAVFEVMEAMFPYTTNPEGVEFKNFECDGESDKQPSPKHVDAAPWALITNPPNPDLDAGGCPTADDSCNNGVFEQRYNSIENFHMCINWFSYGIHPVSGKQIARNIHAHHFFSNGIDLENGVLMIATDNWVHNIGAWQSFGKDLCTANKTPDWYGFGGSSANWHFWGYGVQPGLANCCTGPNAGTCDTIWKTKTIAGERVDGQIEVGCNSGKPDCYGWNTYYEWDREIDAAPGFKTNAGFGITIGIGPGGGRGLMARNVVTNVAKYGYDSYMWTLADDINVNGSIEHSPGDSHVYIAYNDAKDNTISYMCGTFCANTTFLRNDCERQGIEGNLSNSNWCFGSQGDQEYVGIIDNDVLSAYDTAIQISGYIRSSGLIDPTVVIRDNRINNTGQWNPTGTPPNNYHGSIDFFTNIYACPGLSNRYMNPHRFQLINNTVNSSNSGNMAVNFGPYNAPDTCYANRIDKLTIMGGSYGPSSWTTHADDIAEFYAHNITATGVQLIRGPSASQWRWTAGSDGTCSGFTATNGTIPVNGTAAATVTNAGAVGTCGLP